MMAAVRRKCGVIGVAGRNDDISMNAFRNIRKQSEIRVVRVVEDQQPVPNLVRQPPKRILI
jgi:hypothetical protein